MSKRFSSVFALVLLACGASAAEYLQRFVAADQTWVRDVAADAAGNVYICGDTARPAALGRAVRLGPGGRAGNRDGFLIKLAADGRRLAAVVFGGTDFDSAQRLAVGGTGEVVVLGYTWSVDFPTRQPLQGQSGGSLDGFVCKFNATGTNLVFSTYLGGSDSDIPAALAWDGQDILIAGRNDSEEFASGTPSTPSGLGLESTFLVRVAGDGSRLKSSRRFGGSGSSEVLDLAVDAAGNAVLAGWTTSYDFPTTNAVQSSKPLFSTYSAFVTKLAPDGRFVFSTYLAGSCNDWANGVAINGSDNSIVVTGRTCSEEFPDWIPRPEQVQGPGYGFLARLDATGALLDTHRVRVAPQSHLAAVAVTASGHAIAVGTVATDTSAAGVPMFATLSPEGAVGTSFQALACDTLARAEGMAMDPAGNVLLFGREMTRSLPNGSCFVARYSAAALQAPAGPTAKILNPTGGKRLPPRSVLPVTVAVVGGISPAESVSYFDGNRLLGVATNTPFGFQWTNVSPGPHNLRAVARVDGVSVTSCVARFTAQSPRNDHFHQATKLAGERVVVRGDTTAATPEASETGVFAASVWYSWVAPRDGVLEFSAASAGDVEGAGAYLSVYTGSRLDHLVPEAETQSGAPILLRTRRGTNYSIRVASFVERPFLLKIRPVDPPANDSFSQARGLSGGTVNVTTTTRNATMEPGEPGVYQGQATTWYAWTAPFSGRFLASVQGPEQWPQVAAFTGSTLTNLTPVGQEISGTTSGVAWLAQGGVRYFLQLRGGDTNTLTLRIAPRTPPPHDGFADRFRIPPGVTSATGTLIGATMELGEPSSYFPTTRESVWWTWNPPTSGVYRIELTALYAPVTSQGRARPASYSSSGISLYTGDTLDQLTPVPIRNLQSSTVVGVTAGTDYQLQIFGGLASFVVSIRPVPVPGNDGFDLAIPLTGAVAAAVGTTTGASLEPGEPAQKPNPYTEGYEDSVWYRWTAPSNGYYSVSAEGAASLAVYSGTTLASLSPVGPNANAQVLRLTGGLDYRIAIVSGVRFTLIVRPAFPPDNDAFTNRHTVAGHQVAFGGVIRDATAEAGEPPHAGSPARQSIWFNWTAPTNGSYVLASADTSGVPIPGYGNYFGNDSAGRIAVYTGNDLASLMPVAQSAYQGLEFNALAGTSYQIAVEPYYGVLRVDLEIRYQPPPANDDFARRTRLAGERVSLVASNVGATLEPGEQRNGSVAAGQSVWWSWRAPRSGRVTFAVEREGPSYFSPTFRVYSGLSFPNLVPRSASNLYNNSINLAVEAGEELHVSVDQYQSTRPGVFRLGIRYTPKPRNDAFSQRLAFTGVAGGTLEGASREAAEPEPDSQETAASVWWQWRPRTSGMYELRLSGAPYPMGLRVFTGSSLTNLAPVPESSTYPQTLVYMRVTAGTAYNIQVTGSAADQTYTLRTRLISPPGNDAFAHRITLVGTNVSVTTSNVAATAEAAEPPHAGLAAYRSVWWSWTAPAKGTARIKLLNYAFERIAVYQGHSLAGLQLVQEGVAVVVFPVEAGTTYQIALDSHPGSSGGNPLQWLLTLQPPPANDAFANRIPLAGLAVRATGSALGATVEPGEPLSSWSPGHSIWWRWTAPETGRYTFAVSNTAATVLLTLFTGTDLTQLSVVASNGSSRPILNVPVSAGTELQISVDASPEATVDGLALSVRQVTVPANDDFADRVPLTGFRALGNLEGSSVEPGERHPTLPINAPASGTSIWWSLTPTNEGWHSITLGRPPQSSGGINIPPRPPLPPLPALDLYWEAHASVYQGLTVSNLTHVPPRVGTRWPRVYLTAGVEYQVRVAGLDGWFGPVEVVVEHMPGPVNDAFIEALPIVGEDVLVVGSNSLASVESGEPIPFDGDSNSVWWQWTAPSDGVYSITRSNSEVEVYFNVSTGATVSALTVVTNTAFGRDPGEYLFRATAGVTYFISAVSRLFWPEGALQFRFARANPPANDDFARRTELVGASLWLSASNHDATAEPGDPAASLLAQQTVWWRWTAPVTGPVELDAQASDGLLGSVFRGTSIDNLTLEADALFGWPLWFQAEAGVEYAIAITTWSAPASTFTLTLNASAAAPLAGLRFSAPGPGQAGAGARVVETSTNLVDWVPFATNTPGQTEFRLIPDTSQPRRFFRIR